MPWILSSDDRPSPLPLPNYFININDNEAYAGKFLTFESVIIHIKDVIGKYTIRQDKCSTIVINYTWYLPSHPLKHIKGCAFVWTPEREQYNSQSFLSEGSLGTTPDDVYGDNVVNTMVMKRGSVYWQCECSSDAICSCHLIDMYTETLPFPYFNNSNSKEDSVLKYQPWSNIPITILGNVAMVSPHLIHSVLQSAQVTEGLQSLGYVGTFPTLHTVMDYVKHYILSSPIDNIMYYTWYSSEYEDDSCTSSNTTLLKNHLFLWDISRVYRCAVEMTRGWCPIANALSGCVYHPSGNRQLAHHHHHTSATDTPCIHKEDQVPAPINETYPHRNLTKGYVGGSMTDGCLGIFTSLSSVVDSVIAASSQRAESPLYYVWYHPSYSARRKLSGLAYAWNEERAMRGHGIRPNDWPMDDDATSGIYSTSSHLSPLIHTPSPLPIDPLITSVIKPYHKRYMKRCMIPLRLRHLQPYVGVFRKEHEILTVLHSIIGQRPLIKELYYTWFDPLYGHSVATGGGFGGDGVLGKDHHLAGRLVVWEWHQLAAVNRHHVWQWDVDHDCSSGMIIRPPNVIKIIQSQDSVPGDGNESVTGNVTVIYDEIPGAANDDHRGYHSINQLTCNGCL